MKTSKVIYEGDLRTSAVHLQSGEKIITDAPVDNNGKGMAFSPTDLMSTSLANCMMTVMGIAAEARDIEISSMNAEVLKVMAASPRRVSEIHIDLNMHIEPDTERNRKLMEETAKTCPVSKSLHPDILQDINISFV